MEYVEVSVLHKLRLVLRNETLRWVEGFTKLGGMEVIRDDFGGRSVEEVFGVSFAGVEGKGVMERTARASASVAQVHWARLPDGREVAIKIQKPEIEKQIGWDLWAFK